MENEKNDDIGRVKRVLSEAISGTSPKSKNSLIKEAIKILNGIKGE